MRYWYFVFKNILDQKIIRITEIDNGVCDMLYL